MHFIYRKVLAVILSFALLLSFCPISATASGTNNLYVYIGDSMSFNFTGRHQFYYPINIYPQQTADTFGLQLTDAGTLPGGRFTDAYAMMSDYEGDAYTRDELYGFISNQDQKQIYTDSIASASVISMQMGYAGVSMYLLKNIRAIIGDGEPLYSSDLDQIFTPDELKKMDFLASECIALLQRSFKSETAAALKQFVKSLSEKQKSALINLFGENVINTLSGGIDIINQISSSILYVLTAQMIHFDRTVERIYELNPDVEMYVMGLANPLQHLSLGFSLGSKQYKIDLGDMLGYIYDLFNLYMKVLSPNATRYYFVDNCEAIETFGYAMANDLAVTQDILYSYYNNSNFTGHDIPDTPAYKKAAAMAPGVTYALQNTNFIDLSKLVSELPNGLSDIGDPESCFNKLDQLDANGIPKANYAEQLMAHVYMLTMMIGIYVHPTQKTHDAESILLIKAMNEKKVAPEAVAFHAFSLSRQKLSTIWGKSACTGSLFATVNQLVKNPKISLPNPILQISSLLKVCSENTPAQSPQPPTSESDTAASHIQAIMKKISKTIPSDSRIFFFSRLFS